MFKRLVIFSIVILFGVPFANASEQMYTEETIFENISVISVDKIEGMISDSLMDELQSDRIDIELRSYRKGVQFNIEKDYFDVEIVESDINKRTRRFDYKVSFTSGDFRQVLDINGSYDEIISIPSLATRIPFGTVITEDDIEFIDVQAHRLMHDTITDPNELVGKTLKHSKSALRPIRGRDVQNKQIVQRTDNIDILYETPSITVTAKGVAMESGAKGDVIRVRNTSSNKIVEAMVKNSTLAIINTGQL
ncbi:MAG: flagella basal body P-ring formation protein FlgA [Alphaproteobacteria bacterium CG11_big_fil_rev_8_21_14_0_20_39_49]|nr:MAG: flagella basal body P-ring formation protein FlgA [Alphaproteobacteria bacterium CG11_big_fil_rev_8_21_14_0_20_39_49]